MHEKQIFGPYDPRPFGHLSVKERMERLLDFQCQHKKRL